MSEVYQGLNAKDINAFLGLLIKANDQQLRAMRTGIGNEFEKRMNIKANLRAEK